MRAMTANQERNLAFGSFFIATRIFFGITGKRGSRAVREEPVDFLIFSYQLHQYACLLAAEAHPN
jgi:hypothetical protein